MMKKLQSLFLVALLSLIGTSAWALEKDADGVYQISTAQDLVDFATAVNNGEQTAKAVLTADIDLASVTNFESIGKFRDANGNLFPKVDFAFKGEFDGQGHVIKNLTTTNEAYLETGLFGRVAGGAVVKNLGVVNATVGTNHKRGRAGIIAGFNNGSTIENCYTTGTLTINVTAGKEQGGIYGGASSATAKNCWTSYESVAYSGTLTNCYAAADIEGKLTTGELCFKLNGETSEEPVWFQTLGTDQYPVLDATHATVYLATDLNCDGTPKGDVTYNNTGAGTRDAHQYVDGLCTVCHDVDITFMEPVDGVYQIGTAGQLHWFSAAINQKKIENNVEACLTADIDLEYKEFDPIGRFGDNLNGVAYDKVQFFGHFDGKGHVIKNLKITGTGNYETGLFARLGWGSGAWVKNLGVVNATIHSTHAEGRVGAIVGIVGTSCVVDNCFAIGDLNITTDSGTLLGAVVGSLSGTMNNCWTSDEKVAANGTRENCYIEVTEEEMKSGELAYTINQGARENIFFQTLGTDDYPVASSEGHGTVYLATDQTCDGTPKGDITYSNTPDGHRDPHNIVNGFCTVCGQYDPDQIVDGVFQISAPQQLVYFSKYVNTEDRSARASLTADLDMTGVEGFQPIGYFRDGTVDGVNVGLDNHQFNGEFHGNGHVIRNLTIVDTLYHETGFFSRMTDAVVVDNLGFENMKISGNRTNRVGIIVGWMGVPTIKNVFAIGDIEITAAGEPVTNRMFIPQTWDAREVYNCWTIAETFCGNSASHHNCRAAVTPEEMESGKLCYEINQGAGENVFFQTLGTDPYPFPSSEGHGTVYLAVDQNCDGTPKGEASYSNSASGTRDPHQYVDGLCSVCKDVQADYLTPVDGAYLIGTAGELRWFSEAINQKKIPNSSNAKLTADIDLEGEEFSPIGRFGDNAGGVAYEKIQYAGHFDGQGHIVYNLKITGDGNYEIGLIARLQWSSGAWVKNVGVVNAEVSSTNTNGRVGAVVGIVGTTCVVENCFAYNVTLSNASGQEIGGVVGSLSGTMNNCWTNYETHAYRFGTANNCYSLENTPNIEVEAASGELCYKLNGGSFLNPTWFQTIGTDPFPVLDSTHGIVYSLAEGEFASATEENFSELRDAIIATERNYCETVIADQAVIDTYSSELDKLQATETLSDFFTAYTVAQKMKEKVQTSEQIYLIYINACENLIAQLAENTTQNSYREDIENYLDKENPIDPGTYPNGNYGYILDTHTLTDTQIAAEVEYANTLMNRFLISDPEPGTEMTVLLRNPDFTDGWEGWQTENPDVLTIGGQTDVLTVARGLNGSFNVSQTLNELPNGIYVMRVSSFARAAGEPSLKNHTGEIFLNGNQNFVMTPLEGMIPEDQAEDGVNCHLDDDAYVIDEAEGIYGYVPASLVGVSYAFNGGRYQNYVAVEVTDGTLTVGMRERQYDFNLWQPFADIHLYYLGTAEQAADNLTNVLEGYMARANTILNMETESFSEYDQNISQELRSKLETAVAEGEEATDGAKKMELVNTFSDLFNQVYDCRKAYLELGKAIFQVEDICSFMAEKGFLTGDEYDATIQMTSQEWLNYSDGTYTAEQARQKAQELLSNVGGPRKDTDGVFELATAEDLVFFSAYANDADNSAKARLMNDIDMSSVENFTPIGLFRDGTVDGVNVGLDNRQFKGEFHGQGHIIKNLTINEQEYHETGFFSRMTDDAVVDNLGFENVKISAIRSNRVGILVGWMGVPTIKNVFAVGEIELTAAGNPLASRSLNPENWSPREVYNCWTVTEVAVAKSGSHNCYAQVTEDEMKSGKLCYTINQGAGENVFFQTLAEDAYPVPDATHLVVYKAADGTYYNEIIDAIDAVTTDNKRRTDVIYDLSGRRVAKPTKGIYIINGRKVLK